MTINKMGKAVPPSSLAASHEFTTGQEAAVILLRVGLAVVFIAHGSQKLFSAFGGGGIAGTADYFNYLGVHPSTLWAVVAGVVEFGGGLAVGLGLLTRIAAAGLAADMIGAIVLTNWANGFFTEKPSGGWEMNMILFCMAMSVMLTGPGRLSVDSIIRPRVTAWSPRLGRLL